MNYSVRWKGIVREIGNCPECRAFPLRNRRRKVWNGCKIYDPNEVLGKRKSRTLWFSEAPPGGSRSTFFQCDESDQLRRNVFQGLNAIFGHTFDELVDFHSTQNYLLPSYSFPCGNGNENWNPEREMIQASAKHMKKVVDYIRPDRIIFLGRRALWLGQDLGFVGGDHGDRVKDYLEENPHGKVPKAFATYWPRTDYPLHRKGFIRTLKQLKRDGYLRR